MATVGQIIDEVKSLKPDQFPEEIMVTWISDIEHKIVNDIFNRHHPGHVFFDGYDIDDLEEELLVEEPYTEIYRYYCMAMIDFYNNETSRYTNSMQMFNSALQNYKNYFNRTRMPKGGFLKI